MRRVGGQDGQEDGDAVIYAVAAIGVSICCNARTDETQETRGGAIEGKKKVCKSWRGRGGTAIPRSFIDKRSCQRALSRLDSAAVPS